MGTLLTLLVIFVVIGDVEAVIGRHVIDVVVVVVVVVVALVVVVVVVV